MGWSRCWRLCLIVTKGTELAPRKLRDPIMPPLSTLATLMGAR